MAAPVRGPVVSAISTCPSIVRIRQDETDVFPVKPRQENKVPQFEGRETLVVSWNARSSWITTQKQGFVDRLRHSISAANRA
jgi:hypothetical protein